jgi:hypothetical protein
MSTPPLDLAAILREHSQHEAGPQGLACAVTLHVETPCQPYQLAQLTQEQAAALARMEAALADAWDEGWDSGETYALADEQGYSDDSATYAKETNPYRAALDGGQ